MRITIIIGLLIFLQIILIFTGGVYSFLESKTLKGYVPSFANEEVVVVPELQCLKFDDYIVPLDHHKNSKNIHMLLCSYDEGKIALEDSSDYGNGISFERLYYVNEIDSFIVIAKNGKEFYANKSNDYIMEIPIQYEDFNETSIVKIKMHVEYIEPPNYWLWGLIIFSPTILLILILIIRKLRKR